MTGYSDLAQIAQQNDFLNRIRYALCHAAVDVMAESSGTPSHTARLAFAVKVLSGQADLASAAYAVLTNPSIAAGAATDTSGNSVTDSDMQFAMNSVFGGLAGVGAA